MARMPLMSEPIPSGAASFDSVATGNRRSF